jgi:hypothetical protein
MTGTINGRGSNERESKLERESRFLLNRFLTTTDPLLERLLERLVLRSDDQVVHRAGARLQRIWNSARANLKGVIQNRLRKRAKLFPDFQQGNSGKPTVSSTESLNGKEPMANTAYIFGAGASYACSSKTPLIMNFFSRAKDVGYLCDEMRADVTAKLVNDIALDEAALLKGTPDLETVFSLVAMNGEMRSLLNQEVVEGAAEFDAAFLQHRLESFIYELLMTVTEPELKGKGDLYDKLLKKVDQDDCFMTFNYDLQLDRAFERTLQWSPETGYGFKFRKILRTDESWHVPSDKEVEPKLLKLHGSLNWLYSNGYIHRPPSTLDFDKKYVGEHYLAEPLYRFPGGTAFGMQSSVPDNGIEIILQLNIVPPTLRKQLSGGSETGPLRDAWTHAYQALSRAERIVAIGYSLPPTDFHAEWLLRTSVQKNEHAKIDLIVVNPNKNVGQLLTTMFGKKLADFKQFGSFEEFLT